MGKQWVREVVRHDPLQESVDRSVQWLEENRSQALAGAGAVAAAVLIALIAIAHVRSNRDRAWLRYAVAQSEAYGGRPDKALEELKGLAEEQGTTDAAGFGRLLAGDIQYARANYKEALDQYGAVLERGKPASLQP